MTGPAALSVVIPVLDEEPHLPELIERCLTTCRALARPFEIIFVDDGSTDGSVAVIEEAAARNPGEIVCAVLSRNYGQHEAIMSGFAEARGELIITLDADLQNPPEEIPRLVAKIEEGFDVVGTVRTGREDSLFRRISSGLVNRMVRRATGVRMSDFGCMLRAYRSHVVRAMLQCPEHSTFIPVLACTFARRTTEIDVDHASRSTGRSKYGFWKLINLQFDLLTSMTTFPLRMLSILGGAISVLGIGFGVFLLVLRFVYGAEWAAQGVFTLFALLFTFIGAQFIGMGLLGEYLGRVYHDVRARPRSIVERLVGRESPAGGPSASTQPASPAPPSPAGRAKTLETTGT